MYVLGSYGVSYGHKEGATHGVSMPDMATDPVDSSQIGPHLRVPKRRGEQGVRVCPPLVPAGNGLQTAGNNTFSPAPNTCVSAGTLDGVDESPVPSTKIIQCRQLPHSQ